MSGTDFANLNDELHSAPALRIEVLTAAELDAVAGGNYEQNNFACTNGTVSFCHVDGTTDGD